MQHRYVVKTPDGFLYRFANDASLTDDPEQAQQFSSIEEARTTAEGLGYYDDKFDILTLEQMRERRDAGPRPAH